MRIRTGADTEVQGRADADWRNSMKSRVIIPWLIAATAVLSLTGCQDSKAAKEARLSGITQMNEGKYSEAILSFDAALKEADGIVNNFELDILKYRGEAEYVLADYTAAVHTYDILLDVDGEKPEYLYCRAAARALSGDQEAALTDYEKASAMNTEKDRNVYGDMLALSAIGRAYTENGDFEKAMSFFENAESKGAVDAGIYNQMGLCMVWAKKYDTAIGYFEKGLETGDEKQTQELMYNRAAAYEKKGDFAKARELFNEFATAYGSTPELDRELAFLESR